MCVFTRAAAPPAMSQQCGIVGALRSAADLHSNYSEALWGFHGNGPQAQAWTVCIDGRLFPHAHVIVLQNEFLPQGFRYERGGVFLPQ